VSPLFKHRTSPAGTYSSFKANVILSSSVTNGASLGYVSASNRLKSAVLGVVLVDASSLLLLLLVTFISADEQPAASRDEAKKRTFTVTDDALI